jgi:hypothetical protein
MKMNDKQIIRYWIIEFTLTSGETVEFYVKAKTQQDALVIGKSYRHLIELGKLGEFKLFP